MIISLKPGARIEISSLDEAEEQKIYISQISEVLSDDEIEIYMPTYKSRMIVISKDDEYDILIFDGKAIFKSRIHVIDRFKMNNIFILRVKLITPLIKHQRRTFYRQQCNIGTTYRELTKTEYNNMIKKKRFEYEDIPFINGIILDISGGGCRMVSPIPFEIGAYAVLKFELLNMEKYVEYTLNAKVLKVNKLEKNNKLYEYRFEFYDIDSKKQEGIIQYVFEEQRKIQKRNTGL